MRRVLRIIAAAFLIIGLVLTVISGLTGMILLGLISKYIVCVGYIVGFIWHLILWLEERKKKNKTRTDYKTGDGSVSSD